ncbi:MAG: hypothetical protein JW862_13695 [Anaerolineales bacterium]|nr:hypothetical protein [Anaerolineales bacterium]
MPKLRSPLLALMLLLTYTLNTFQSGPMASADPLTLSQVLAAATSTANDMEINRLVPSEFEVGTSTLNSAQIIAVFAEAIVLIAEKQSTELGPVPDISPPGDLYPFILLDDELYSSGVYQPAYLDFCSQLIEIAQTEDTMPGVFYLLDHPIRFPETLHFLSGILRFYNFFGYLPETQDLTIISPKGLIPWETPSGYEEHTAIINGWSPYSFIRYNYYSAGSYEMFSRAQEIIGAETDYVEAGRQIHTWVKTRWNQAGYFIYSYTFGGRMSASERIRHNVQNSAFHFDKMNGLFRSLGIPASENRLYSESLNDWVTTDIHCLYGSSPEDCRHDSWHLPHWDFQEPPDLNTAFIREIRAVMRYSGTSRAGFKSLWINPADVQEFGAAYIVSMAKAGGFNTLIVTVKTELGNLYFPTTNFSDQFQFDAITSLANQAASENMDVLAGFSVLADHHTLSQNIGWRNMSEDDPDPNFYYPNVSISPCVAEYKNTNLAMLAEINQISQINGIVLAHLYWDTISYSYKMGGNPACAPYSTYEGWQEDLLKVYAEDLVNAIKTENPSWQVIIASYPVTTGRYPNFYGHEDKVKMAEVADAIIIPYDGNYWLTDVEDWPYVPGSPVPFDLGSYISGYASQISKPVIVSQNITDEWAFPGMFYSGLLGFVQQYGADGINLHSPTTMLGEYGVSFTRNQYQKISSIDFDRAYSWLYLPLLIR